MMKNSTWEPEIEIIRFGEADIVTTSGGWDFELDEDETPPVIIPR